MIDRRQLIGLGAGLAAASAQWARTAEASQSAEPVTWFRGPGPQAEALGLRWAFSKSVFFADRVQIESPIPRGFTSVAGGEIWGPRLQGRVLPHSGADYPLIQTDRKKNIFNTHYLLQASNGDLIYIRNRGTIRRHALVTTPGASPRPESRMRFGPVFEAPRGPHEWLNRTVFVGHAQRHEQPDHTVFTYYELL